MAFVPAPLYDSRTGFITPWSLESLAAEFLAQGQAAAASTIVPTANTIVYIPFGLAEPETFKKGAWLNGGTVGGTVDIGVYDSTGTGGSPGTLLVKTNGGPITQTTINVLQENDITDTLIPGPGRFYLAWVSSSASAYYFAIAPAAPRCQAFGIMTEASSTLNATATAIKNTTWAYIPVFGFSRTTVMV